MELLSALCQTFGGPGDGGKRPDYGSVGLWWGLRICIADELSVMLMPPVQGSRFVQRGSRKPTAVPCASHITSLGFGFLRCKIFKVHLHNFIFLSCYLVVTDYLKNGHRQFLPLCLPFRDVTLLPLPTRSGVPALGSARILFGLRERSGSEPVRLPGGSLGKPGSFPFYLLRTPLPCAEAQANLLNEKRERGGRPWLRALQTRGQTCEHSCPGHSS